MSDGILMPPQKSIMLLENYFIRSCPIVLNGWTTQKYNRVVKLRKHELCAHQGVYSVIRYDPAMVFLFPSLFVWRQKCVRS